MEVGVGLRAPDRLEELPRGARLLGLAALEDVVVGRGRDAGRLGGNPVGATCLLGGDDAVVDPPPSERATARPARRSGRGRPRGRPAEGAGSACRPWCGRCRSRSLALRPISGQALEAPDDDVAVARIELDQPSRPPRGLARRERRARTREGVEHQIASARRVEKAALDELGRLGGRVLPRGPGGARPLGPSPGCGRRTSRSPRGRSDRRRACGRRGAARGGSGSPIGRGQRRPLPTRGSAAASSPGPRSSYRTPTTARRRGGRRTGGRRRRARSRWRRTTPRGAPRGLRRAWILSPSLVLPW